jgi:hypothetical protein
LEPDKVAGRTAVAADPPSSATGIASVVDGAVRVGFERTLEQDPGLGMRQMCDAACKALSPAINDPYTAIQASEHLSVLFAALAPVRWVTWWCATPSGRCWSRFRLDPSPSTWL